MINYLEKQALLKADNKAFKAAVVDKLNEIARAINTGTVWDNKVEADRKNEATNTRIDPIELANSIAFVTLAEAGQIDDVTATENIELFEPWAVGVHYAENSVRVDPLDQKLYRLNEGQAHTSEEGWNPSLTPALWTVMGDPAEEWPEWVQPIGAHDAYSMGDKVTHNEKHWTSDVDANVWEPPLYWTEAQEEPETEPEEVAEEEMGVE